MNNLSNINAKAAPTGFQKREGGNLLDVHNQWKSRPADQQVFSIDELLRKTAALKDRSREIEGVPWAELKVVADARGGLGITRGSGVARFNNFSFSQFCSLPTPEGDALAQAGFVSKLSARLAAEVLNERLAGKVARKSAATLLVSGSDLQGGASATLRSVTSDKYERIFNADIALRLQSLCSRGGWGPASAFARAGEQVMARGARGEQKPLPLGWLSDRNMFVLLVDYSRPIELDGSVYSRFFVLSNSEVGDGKLNVMFGLLDYVCCNMILWGCTQVYEASFRHTKSIHERWNELSSGISTALRADNTSDIADGIAAARKCLIADTQDEVVANVIAVTELPKSLVVDAYQRVEATPRYGNPASVWGMVNGLTEASQYATEHADKRTAIDLKAARLMGLLKR